MSKQEVMQKLQEIFREVEKSFKMRFKMKEVSSMKNVGEMAEIILERI